MIFNDKKVQFPSLPLKKVSSINRTKTPYHRPKSEKNQLFKTRATTYRRRPIKIS